MQPQRGGDGSPRVDLPAGQIDADELAFGQGLGQGQQVAARGAAQLEHAAASRRRRLHPQQSRQRRQAIGVRGIARATVVGHLVVAV